MLRPIRNKRSQICGYIDIDKRAYFTTRRKEKDEIFLKKNWFDGKYIHTPIAIDKYILGVLKKNNIGEIIVTIIGIERLSYEITFSTDWVINNGVEINFDKKNKLGQCYTGFSSQIVFEADKSKVPDNFQKTLQEG